MGRSFRVSSVIENEQLTPKQLDEIIGLFAELSPHRTFSLEQYMKAKAQPNFCLALSHDNRTGIICGMASLGWIHFGGKTKAFIEDVVVLKEYRRAGIAEVLIRQLIKVAEEVGADTVDLTSNDSRVEAHGLYRKLGFEVADTNLFRLKLSL